MPIRIAVVQQDGNPGQPEKNREKAIQFAWRKLWNCDPRTPGTKVNDPTYTATDQARSSDLIFGIAHRTGSA